MSTSDEAVQLMIITRDTLSTEGLLILQKIHFNDKIVLSAFIGEDLSKSLKSFDLTDTALSVQQSLGLS
ncbi:hypothetical protein DPMN_126590 [Dreissena polymorpha]|uniref:Uncharacterized protein n=1 Tax=Dreissena polymorpha TaxID=45954 RepID=A0A9D4JY31_DREPO|nr:hypothetical protein DPMN_126590 [Dreissena polymorpha]